MKRFFKFFRESYELGLSKEIIIISIFLYIISVFFEAIGIALILPIISLFINGGAIESIIENQTSVKSIINYIDGIGITPNKHNFFIIFVIVILLRQLIIFIRVSYSAAMIAKLVYQLRKKAGKKEIMLSKI